MRGLSRRRARPLGLLLLLTTALSLIVSAALVHVVPPHTPDGASHVTWVSDPSVVQTAEKVAPEGGLPAPHEHFDVDHDGTISPRMDDGAGAADLPDAARSVPPLIPFAHAARLSQRTIAGPSLISLSISRI